MIDRIAENLNTYFKENFSPRTPCFTNIEKREAYNIPNKYWGNRKKGISAMMRLKNDEKWVKYAILSILDQVDEIVVTLQNSTDKTEEIIRLIQSDKIKIFYFPFDSYPNQPNYGSFPHGSVYNRAYFYNWSLSKTSFSWVWKWDGDHAAFDNSAKLIRNLALSGKYDIIHYKGVDMYGSDLRYVCKTPYCGNEPAIFRVTNRTFYFAGDFCEEFSYPVWKNFFCKSRIYNIPEPQFLHFKYAVPIDEIGKGWPENWQNIKFFQDLVGYKSKGEAYVGDLPKVLDDYILAFK